MGCKNGKEEKTNNPASMRSLSQLDGLGSPAMRTMNLKNKNLHHVVLTGGPCAGKSTALSVIQTKLPQQTGIKVFTVPEAATLLVNGGLEWTDMTEEKVVEYQLALLRVQLALENNILAIAAACGQPALVVSDRGTMDGRAYCSEGQFTEILERGNFQLEHLRDSRYDAVIHMVTSALGAEKYYNFDNPARYESLEEARSSDEHLRQMYVGHSRLKVFDNSAKSFEEKLDRVYDFVCQVVGHMPFQHHHTRRYLLAELPDESKIPVQFVRLKVTVTILSYSTSSNIKLVMKREQGANSVFLYFKIQKQAVAATSQQSNGDTREASVSSLDGIHNRRGNGNAPSETSGNSIPGSPEKPTANTTAPPSAEGSTHTLSPSHATQDAVETIKTQHRITAVEYSNLVLQRDMSRCDLVKENISFMYGDYYYEVGKWVSPDKYKGQALMYVDCGMEALPPFIKVEKDVTHDSTYSSYSMSLKGKT